MLGERVKLEAERSRVTLSFGRMVLAVWRSPLQLCGFVIDRNGWDRGVAMSRSGAGTDYGRGSAGPGNGGPPRLSELPGWLTPELAVVGSVLFGWTAAGLIIAGLLA